MLFCWLILFLSILFWFREFKLLEFFVDDRLLVFFLRFWVFLKVNWESLLIWLLVNLGLGVVLCSILVVEVVCFECFSFCLILCGEEECLCLFEEELFLMLDECFLWFFKFIFFKCKLIIDIVLVVLLIGFVDVIVLVCLLVGLFIEFLFVLFCIFIFVFIVRS